MALLQEDHDRGRRRSGPESLLRHASSPAALSSSGERSRSCAARRRCSSSTRRRIFRKGPRPELPGPRAQRADRQPGTVHSRTWRTAPRSCRSTISRRKAGRSTSHATCCRPSAQDIPPLPEAVDAFKIALVEARAAEDHLRTVLTEGGWLK